MNDEGEPETFEAIISTLLKKTLQILPKSSVMPVLRGYQWPSQVIQNL